MTVHRFTAARRPWSSAAVTFSMLLVAACAPPTPPTPTLARRVLPLCPEPSSNTYYFSEAAISPHRSDDLSYAAEFSKYLQASGVPSLSCGTAVEEAYRLLWIQGNRPAGVIALSRRVEDWEVTSVEYVDPLRFHQRSTVATQTNSRVTNDGPERLMAALQSGGFWKTLSWEPSQANTEDMWIIEGRTKTGYHVVTRRSLRDATFRALGVPFFTAARLPLPERTVSTDKDLR